MRKSLWNLCLSFKRNLTFSRARHFVSNMSALLQPPPNVRGMIQLDRSAFTKSIKVPTLRLGGNVNFNSVFPCLKKLLLKMEHLKPVINVTESAAKKILLHPSVVSGWDDLPKEELEAQGLSSAENLTWDELELSYENWKPDEIFKAVLPADQENSSSFSRVGHVLHLNLRDHLLGESSLCTLIFPHNRRSVFCRLQNPHRPGAQG
jgi:tRNA (guanine37-N1)-methyltransferase